MSGTGARPSPALAKGALAPSELPPNQSYMSNLILKRWEVGMSSGHPQEIIWNVASSFLHSLCICSTTFYRDNFSWACELNWEQYLVFAEPIDKNADGSFNSTSSVCHSQLRKCVWRSALTASLFTTTAQSSYMWPLNAFSNLWLVINYLARNNDSTSFTWQWFISDISSLSICSYYHMNKTTSHICPKQPEDFFIEHGVRKGSMKSRQTGWD